MPARYDAVADWYEQEFADAPLAREAAARLLGRGSGRLIDVGCGGGSHAVTFAELGWRVVGVDESEAQLAYARRRGVDAVRADAAALPLPDASFDAATCIWLHTDADDFAAAVSEVHRVLRPRAPFVYLGAHPCFVGPHAHFVSAQGVPELHPGYAQAGRYGADAPGVGPHGLRAKVGGVHLPLQDFLAAFLDVGFLLERFEELGVDRYPFVVATRWRR